MPLRRALTPGGRRFLLGATAAMLALPPIALAAMRLLVDGSDIAALAAGMGAAMAVLALSAYAAVGMRDDKDA